MAWLFADRVIRKIGQAAELHACRPMLFAPTVDSKVCILLEIK
jgi:hypothetical protein